MFTFAFKFSYVNTYLGIFITRNLRFCFPFLQKQAPTGHGSDWVPPKCLPAWLLSCLLDCFLAYLLARRVERPGLKRRPQLRKGLRENSRERNISRVRESSREKAQERELERELKLVSSGEKAQKRENWKKKLKRGRLEEPCPVGACFGCWFHILCCLYA